MKSKWYDQPSRVLLLAIWFGLLTGLGEIVHLAYDKFYLNRIIRQSPDVVWMAPLANVVYFLLPALGLWLLARWQPRLVSLRVTTFVFSALGLAAWLLMYAQLTHAAAYLLAVGLAVQVSFLINRYPRKFYALVEFTLGWVRLFGGWRKSKPLPQNDAPVRVNAGLSRRQFLYGTSATLAGLAVGTQSWQLGGENLALMQFPPAPNSLPNVLLIVLDTVRAENLSLHGYARPTTPQLERLAAQGVVFDWAIATSPWTLPSHAGIFTGHFPHQMATGWYKPLGGRFPVLAEALSQKGYATVSFVANLLYCISEYGLNRGFAHYEDYPVSAGQIVLSSSLGQVVSKNSKLRDLLNYRDDLNRKPADTITREFLQWHARNGGRPFFAFLNYFDAHTPYLPPPPFDTMFGPPRARLYYPEWMNKAWKKNRTDATRQKIQAERDAYDGALAYLDQQVGLLLGALAKRGVLDQTLVIITSDHGEQIAEHDYFGHGNTLYLNCLRVPLLLRFPARVPAGLRVRQPVSLGDLPITVFDLLGVQGGGRFPGVSLARFWENKPGASDRAPNPALSSFTPSTASGDKQDLFKSIVAEGWHYFIHRDGKPLLFDVETDPLETRNLADSEEGRRLSERFDAALAQIPE